MLAHCRPTVERYIFGKLFNNLFAMYAVKNEAIDSKFNMISE
jgi:hypothetical protein